MNPAPFTSQFKLGRQFGVRFVSVVVGLHGLFIIVSSLLDQVALRHSTHIAVATIDAPLLIGLSLLYLSTLLRRQKQTAWLVTILAYTFYLVINVAALVSTMDIRQVTLLLIIRACVLPLAVLLLLIVLRPNFTVRSDIQGFRVALGFSLTIVLVAFMYGTLGFLLFDKSDFHEEIKPLSAARYTLEQFGLSSSSHTEHPYTRRARIFEDSLSFVGIGAAAYVAISLFQPLRLRLTNQDANRRRLHDLLLAHGGSSEDFFKLWPQDKQYFFDNKSTSAVAFRVYHGTALCLGNPVGNEQQFRGLLTSFEAVCFGNDWRSAFIHVGEEHRKLYEQHGYSLQKIGQEAVVDLAHFETTVAGNKYFRHIRNKFEKHGYTSELLQPPHSAAVIKRLQAISDDWLSVGGRSERGFAMGYFTPKYMQLCPIMVVRDDAGTIEAFVNQLPSDFNTVEANFDLLRHASDSAGNINDFLLINFIANLSTRGYQQLNLGLCPLTGLADKQTDANKLLDNVLHFAYANGDRFYSFSGLHRFKSKYEPEWHNSYIAYQGGIRGFSRTTTALMRTMRVRSKYN